MARSLPRTATGDSLSWSSSIRDSGLARRLECHVTWFGKMLLPFRSIALPSLDRLPPIAGVSGMQLSDRKRRLSWTSVLAKAAPTPPRTLVCSSRYVAVILRSQYREMPTTRLCARLAYDARPFSDQA
jgi:hypothetical protein